MNWKGHLRENMITLSKQSVVPIKTLMKGYDPQNSADRLCPTRRAQNSQMISVAEKRDRRMAAGQAADLNPTDLAWLNDYNATGRHEVLDYEREKARRERINVTVQI